MIVLFSNDDTCDKSVRCSEMLNTISEVYKNQCGIIHTADFDML